MWGLFVVPEAANKVKAALNDFVTVQQNLIIEQKQTQLIYREFLREQRKARTAIIARDNPPG